MLAAAGRHVLRAELCLETTFSCECSSSCHATLKARLPGKCIFTNLLHRFGGCGSPSDTIGRHVQAGRLNFAECGKALLRAQVARGSACEVHGAACPLGHIDLDVAGSPCQPWSTAGRRQGREDPRSALTIAWLAWLRHARPRAAVHENVIGFDAKVLEELVGDMYFIRGIRMSPSDMVFPSCVGHEPIRF